LADGFGLTRSSSAIAGVIKEKVSAALISVAMPRLRARIAMGKSVEDFFVNLL
jgi:hypothetical protein